MTDDIDYSKAPQSITELRSQKDGDASKQTVRDVLIQALRDLDSGEESPDCCVVIFGTKHADGGASTTHYQRTDNRYECRGLISDALQNMTFRDWEDR